MSIESELGKNGWLLVRRIMVGVVTALAIQTVVAGFILAEWKGEITAKMDRAVTDIAANASNIKGLEAARNWRNFP